MPPAAPAAACVTTPCVASASSIKEPGAGRLTPSDRAAVDVVETRLRAIDAPMPSWPLALPAVAVAGMAMAVAVLRSFDWMTTAPPLDASDTPGDTCAIAFESSTLTASAPDTPTWLPPAPEVASAENALPAASASGPAPSGATVPI